MDEGAHPDARGEGEGAGEGEGGGFRLGVGAQAETHPDPTSARTALEHLVSHLDAYVSYTVSEMGHQVFAANVTLVSVGDGSAAAPSPDASESIGLAGGHEVLAAAGAA